MILPRIYRPNKDKGYTIQAQLGSESCHMIHKGRGEFIGLKEIRKYISENDIEIACQELGTMMALIHFVGKNDAYDIEVFLGKELHSKKSRFYIADFDLSEEIKQYDDDTIERICWSLDAIPYFPNNNNKKLFDLFKNGYSKIAQNHELVEKIFENYG
jgi:tRNA A-37 threonylcarbamoyl transferase component Bud32